MAGTYGKKRRPLLPSFSRGEFGTTTKSEREASSNQGNSLRTLPGTGGSGITTSRNFDEEASKLLDTTLQSNEFEDGQGFPSDRSRSEIRPPQLPHLNFNDSNLSEQIDEASRISAATNNSFSDTSAPVIPRKSSKRRSGYTKSVLANSQSRSQQGHKFASRKRGAARRIDINSISAPILDEDNANSPPIHIADDLNQKIANMQAATVMLKPPLQKKRRVIGSKVMEVLRTAARIVNKSGDRVQKVASGEKSPENSAIHQMDMDSNLTAGSVSNSDIQHNEGVNIANPKLVNLIGHAVIRRKPIGEDTKSFRSGVSMDDMFSGRSNSERGQRRAFTSYNLREQVATSSDDSMSDLPKVLHPSNSARLLRSKTAEQFLSQTDFDMILSSSPLAQSTPRIRLEPADDESGNRRLRHVAADSRSVFDTDVSSVGDDLDAVSVSASKKLLHPGRLNPRGRHSTSNLRPRTQTYRHERVKKHPSPSPEELGQLEEAIKTLPTNSKVSGSPEPTLVLRPKDENKRLSGSHSRRRCNLEVRVATMDDFKPHQRKFHGSLHVGPQVEDLDKSMMDIDPLQAMSSEYDIGMGSVY